MTTELEKRISDIEERIKNTRTLLQRFLGGVKLTKDLIIPAGKYETDIGLSVENAKLTLEPGVEIIFKEYSTGLFMNNSELIAEGTENQPIILKKEQTKGGCGIIFNGSSNGSRNLILDYVNIERFKDTTAIKIYEANFEITNCKIEHNYAERFGALGIEKCRGELRNNFFRHNTAGREGGAIFLIDHHGDVIIEENLFEKNKSHLEGGAISGIFDLEKYKNNSFMHNSPADIEEYGYRQLSESLAKSWSVNK